MPMPSMALPVGSRSSAEEPSAVSRSNIGCGACWENVCCSAVPWLHGSATQAANKQNLRALEASCGPNAQPSTLSGASKCWPSQLDARPIQRQLLVLGYSHCNMCVQS